MSEPDRLRVALVGGPMYDRLYEVFSDDVEIIVHDDHPTLNERVAQMLSRGERLDVISTHSKYAPSQSAWLHPLDGLLGSETLMSLAPLAVDLCKFQGQLLCAPRLVDVRIVWFRHDRIPAMPATWDELVESDIRFGFPGRESGLFGTFYELVVGAGGSFFDEERNPHFVSREAEEAIHTLTLLSQRLGSSHSSWHYDEVDSALLDGSVDAAAAWPGAWGSIRTSALAAHLVPAPYFSGSLRKVSYSGCHAWAIPTTCADLGASIKLLRQLLEVPAQLIDAHGGTMCANQVALDTISPEGDIDTLRLSLTKSAITNDMITYPPMSRFPEIESAGWHLLQDAMRGTISPRVALDELQRAAVLALM